MKKGKLIGKIFGIALVFVMVGTIFGGLAGGMGIGTTNYVYAASLSVPSFKQCDSMWGANQLGTCSGDTICSAGCAVTSVAMILKYYGVATDPSDLNNWLRDNSGYASGCLIVWDRADDRSGGAVQWAGKYTTDPSDWGTYTTNLPAQVKWEIDQGYPCVGGLDGHFVVITGYSDSSYYINDSYYDRSTISQSSITKIYTYHGSPSSQPPYPPTLVSPGSGSYPGPTITTLTPWFNWNSVPGADYYGLYIRDLDTDVIVFDSQLDYGPIYGTSFPLPSGILSYGTHYRWNMNSHSSAGWGDYSDRLWFTTYVMLPIVEFFHVSPGSVALGEEFTITYIVSDNSGFGLKQTELWRANDVGGIPDWDGTQNPIQVSPLPGYDSYAGGFYDAPPAVGTYWYGLHVVNNAGEWNDERNSRTGGAPGVFGPFQVKVIGEDTTPPTVNAFSVVPSSVTSGNTFTISYTVSDTGVGLGWIQLWRKYETANWEQVGSSTLSGVGNGPYSGSFYDTPLAVGTYWYGIHVGDDAGNWITEGDSGFSPIEVEVIPAPPATIYVPDNYPTIQAAVNAANPGDTIIVRAGTYTENIDVGKDHLTIQSENGAAVTIVQAANPDDDVFDVFSDYVTIKGFTVKGPTNMSGRGIALIQAEHCYISDNIVWNTDFGIWLYLSSDNTVTQNIALNNGASGIHLTFSANNFLINNIARGNWQGIYLYSSPNNILTGNTMLDNQRNFFVEAWDLSSFVQSIDVSNKVNGKPIQYLVGRSGLIIDSSWDIGYLGIVNCTDITVQGLSLNNNNGQGVLLAFSSFSRIEGINVSNNLWGIDVCGSSSNTIADNTVSNNMYGIRLYLSSANTVIGNTASDNEIGIYLYYYCSGNTLASNTASNNGNGIVLLRSSGNTITSNTASNNFNGIQVYDYSCGNVLTDNTASNNSNGIWLCDYSSNNILTHNTASNNYLGIFSYSSSDNTLTKNTLSSNYQYGILVRYSDNNVIYLNNLIDNANGVYSDDSANTWHSPEEVTYTYNANTYTNYLGNYWSNYTGSDTNEDGIGETPYPIDSDADNYPLAEPFENYLIGEDTTSPTVSSVSPEDGAAGIDVATVVTATFSEAMDETTIDETSFTLVGSAVSGTVTYDPATCAATFMPSAALEYNHTYTVTLSTAITDLAGNPLTESYAWSFTTEAALAVSRIWGTVHVTDPDGNEHPLGGALTWLTQWTEENPYSIVAEAITDEEGGFSFNSQLGSGLYNIITWLSCHSSLDSAVFSVYHNDIQVHVVSPLIDFSAGSSEEVNIDFSDPLLRVLDFTYITPPDLSSSLLPRDRLDDLAMTYVHAQQVIDFETDVLGVTLDLDPPIEVHAYSDQTNGAFYNGEIYIGEDISDYDNGNRPMNREWHESFHQLMDDTIAMPPHAGGSYNHNGYDNPDTQDSWTEGWAEFWPCALWDDLGLNDPHVYRMAGVGHIPIVDWWLVGGPVNFEENWKAWDDQDGSSREEFAVASLLWDLYDPVNTGDREWELIWEWYHDHLELSTDQIWQVVANNNLQDMKDVYDALRAAEIGADDPDEDGIDSLDELFIMHGFFADTNGNRRYDEGEEIGRAADQARPDRRMTPGIENAYLLLQVTDQFKSPTDATIVYDFKYESPWDYLNYTYEIPISNSTETILAYLEPSPVERPVTVEIYAMDSSGNLSDMLSLTNRIYWENVARSATGYVLQHTFEIGATQKTTILGNVNVDPDAINIRSKGKCVTVYIELPEGYDVSQIDVSSITLNGTVPALTKPTAIGDYDIDSVADLMVKFDASAVKGSLTPGGQAEITITGEVGGIAFEGSDTIRVINQ